MSIPHGAKDRDPFFYFVKDGVILHTMKPERWGSNICEEAAHSQGNCEMWAYHYDRWIRYNRGTRVFDIMEDWQAPEVLKLALMLE